nr:EAL domain-containing protein [Entomospira culicis]
MELSIPLLMVFSIVNLVLSFPSVSYQIWLRSIFNIADVNIHYIINSLWVIVNINFVVGISYILAESFNKTSVVGMARYRSFISVGVSVSAYMIFAITNRDFLYTSYGGGLQRYPAEVFLSMVIAMGSSRLFIAFFSLQQKRRHLYNDMSNPVLSRVYDAMMPAISTLSVFILLKLIQIYVDFSFVVALFDRIYLRLHGNSTPTNLGQAISYVLLENVYWLFGIDSSMILNDITGHYLTTISLPGYNIFEADSSIFIFSRTFFAHFVYLGGEGALLSLVVAYWWFRVRTDYDRTIQLSTFPVIFNINKLLIYGLPIVANPLFILPFLLTPLVLTITSYLAFSWGFIPAITRNVSWYMPIGLSGYQSTGSIAGAILQLFNLTVGVIIYAPFLLLSKKVRDHDYNQGRKELIEFSINRYVSEENYLNVRTDVVGAAARILSADLRVALRTGQLYLVYQPKVNFLEQKVHGGEALIRWEHPIYGFIPPPVIISIAEENDLLNELSHWVITESMSQVASWQQQGLNDVHIGVNLSAREINHPHLSDFILNTIKFFGLKPEQIEVEIVETMELSMNDLVQQQLSRLVEHGVTLAIDDFGVGHGSAIYLKNFDISTLKVDKAISDEAHRDPRVAAIFNGVMLMCNDLAVEMVIEHVETEEQLEYLVSKGGKIFQGYFFSKPLSASDFFTYMKAVEADPTILTKSIVSADLRKLFVGNPPKDAVDKAGQN